MLNKNLRVRVQKVIFQVFWFQNLPLNTLPQRNGYSTVQTLLREVVLDEAALFAGNFIRMSLICSFIFCCNGQSVSFFRTKRLMSQNHQSNKILIRKKRMHLLLMFVSLSLSTLCFQILLTKMKSALYVPLHHALGNLCHGQQAFKRVYVLQKWALLNLCVFILHKTKFVEKKGKVRNLSN